MTVFNKLTTNTLIQAVERVVSVGLGLATVAVLTRLLGVEGFGTYSTIIVLLQFAASLIDFGLGLTLSQLIAERDADRPKILGTIIPLRIATSCLAFAIAAIFAAAMPYPNIVPLGVLAAAGAFIGLQLTQLLAGYFRAELAIGIVAIAEVAQRAVYLGILVWLALHTASATLPAILWSATVTQLLAAIALVVALRSRVPLRWQFDLAMAKTILCRNLPLSLSMLATLFYFKADTIILSLYRSASEVGLYSAPYRLLEVLVNLPHLFLSLVLPLATAAWEARDTEKLKTLWQWSFTMTTLLTLPMLVGGLLLAQPLIVTVAGADFAASAALLQILLAATAFIMLGTQSAYIVLATKKQKNMVPIYVVASVVTVGLYFLLIPRFGAFAAAWITLAVEAVMAAANTFVAARTLGWFPPLRSVLPILGATLAMTVIVLLTRQQPFAVTLLLGAVTYLVALPQFGLRFSAFQKS